MPQDRSPARTRLLDAADALFYHQGIAKTGVDDVLEEAGVSVATLYAHFGSKDGLIAASLQRRLDIWQRLWTEAVEAATSDEDRLLAIFDALELYRERHLSARWCAFLATATELPDDSHPAHEPILADTRLLLERLKKLSEPLAGKHADQLAEQVLLAYNGTLAGFLREHPEDPVSVGRQLAATAIRALSPAAR